MSGPLAGRVPGQPFLSADGRFILVHTSPDDRFGGSLGPVSLSLIDRLTGEVELLSVSTAGDPADHDAWVDGISADGRLVVFSSRAGNLVPSDTNQEMDVFLRDRLTGETRRVSVAPDGRQAKGYSSQGSISADGSFLAFSSSASNLIGPDENRSSDVFLLDLSNGHLVVVSQADDGTRGNRDSGSPVVSRDGRFVVFASAATNLVPGDTNGASDVFRYDRVARTIRRLSLSSEGHQANGDSSLYGVSADGGTVLFFSWATNLAGPGGFGDQFYLHHVDSGITEAVLPDPRGARMGGRVSSPRLSADGQSLVFESDASDLVEGDGDGLVDVFLYDVPTGSLVRVSALAERRPGYIGAFRPSVSADGRYVLFQAIYSLAADLGSTGWAQVLVADLSPGSPPSWLPTATPEAPPSSPTLLSAQESIVPTGPSATASGTPKPMTPAPAGGAPTSGPCGSVALVAPLLVGVSVHWRRRRRPA